MIRFIIISILLVVSVPVQANPPASQDWRLIWSDEFNSGSTPENPNPDNWGYEHGYVRNNEWQYYTDSIQNAYCKDGFLHIEAHKHPAGTYPAGTKNPDYQDGSISSASLVTRQKVAYRYGWIEMRARIDTQQGSWPAFWTLGSKGEWPDNGECDIMEYYKSKLHFNVAWWKTGDTRWNARWDSVPVSLSSLPAGWENQFHVWAMEWTPDYVKLYMDGVLYNSWDSSKDNNAGGDTSIEGFQQTHYLLLNQAIGGNAGGNASGIVYPTNYEIDYVRWHQIQHSNIPNQLYNRSDFTVNHVRGADSVKGSSETGNKFTTGSASLTITGLGFIDLNNADPAVAPDGDGLLKSHRVTLWLDSDGSKVAEVTVPSGTEGNLIGSFRYAPISQGPLTLQPNTDYIVSADNYQVQDFWLQEEPLVPGSDFIGGNISDSTSWEPRWGASDCKPNKQNHTGYFYGLANITSERFLRAVAEP